MFHGYPATFAALAPGCSLNPFAHSLNPFNSLNPFARKPRVAPTQLGAMAEAPKAPASPGPSLPTGHAPYAAASARLSRAPFAIAPGPDHNLWFTEHAANRVGRITPLGTVTEFVLPDPGAPAGIAAGPDGNIYFAENSGNRIDRISPAGWVDEFALPNPNSLPNGIVTGADGNLWFTEIGAQKVGRLTPAGDVTEYTLPAAGMPLDIALLPMVESAFNPIALSTARAAGIWQFMPATGHYCP